MEETNSKISSANSQNTVVAFDFEEMFDVEIKEQHSPVNPVRGVCWDRFRKQWKAQACYKGKKYNIGRFDHYDDAVEAYMDFRATNRAYG